MRTVGTSMAAPPGLRKLKIMSRPVIASSTVLTATLIFGAGCNNTVPESCTESVAPECDLTDDACVAAYSDHVACIRGSEASVPSLEIVSPATVLSQLSDESPSVSVSDRCLATLGLEYIDVEAPRSEPRVPAAIYSFDERKVLVVDPNDSREVLRMIALAHIDEGVGGIVDLISEADTFDAQLALRARLFGEALFVGDVAWWKMEPMSNTELRDLVERDIYFGDEIADLLWWARYQPAGWWPLVSYFDFYGAQYVLDRWVDGTFSPESSELEALDSRQVVLGQLQETVVVDFAEMPSIEGYETVWTDSLGPLATHTHFTRADPPPEDTVAVDRERLAMLADISRGDRLTCLYDAENDAVAASWEIAIEDVEALPYPLEYEGLGVVKHTIRDERVFVVGAEDLTIRDRLFEKLM